MRKRRKFGLTLNGDYPRPAVPGELPDVEPTSLTVIACRPAKNGLQDFDVAFTFPPHDPTTSNVVSELHLVVFGPGHGIPTDPEIAINSPHPKSQSQPSASLAVGGDHVVTVKGCPEGNLNFVSVLSYDEDDATDPNSSSSTAPADPSSTASSDPTSAPVDPADPTSNAPADPSTTSAPLASPSASS